MFTKSTEYPYKNGIKIFVNVPCSLEDIIYNSNRWPIDLKKSFTFQLVEKGSNYLMKEFPDKKEYEDAKEKVQEL